jgi:hypothetical protein
MQHDYFLILVMCPGLVMDPRVEYHEVVSIVSGLDSTCISEKETWMQAARFCRDMLPGPATHWYLSEGV